MRTFGRVVLACAAAIGFSTAQAATLCVSQNEDEGDECYSYINNAIDDASTGDTILIRPGIYDEKIYIDVDGITLKGASANTTQIGAAEVEPVGVLSHTSPVIEVAADNVTITGLTVLVTDEVDGIYGDGADFLTIRRVIVSGAGDDGIDVYGESTVVEQSSILDTSDAGVRIEGTSARVVRNQLSQIGGAGIRVEGESALIERNTIDGTGLDGEEEQSEFTAQEGGGYDQCVYLQGSHGTIVRRNQCVSSEGFLGTGNGESDNLVVENNVSTGNYAQLYVDGANPRVVGNRFEGTEGDGDSAAVDVYCDDECADGKVERNRVTSVSSTCFDIYADGTGLRVAQNTAIGCGGVGMDLDTGCGESCGSILAEKNTVSDTSHHCFRADGDGDITLRSNRASDCGGEGSAGFKSRGEGARQIERNTAAESFFGFRIQSNNSLLSRNRATKGVIGFLNDGCDNTFASNFAVGNDSYDYCNSGWGATLSGNTFGTFCE